MNAVPAPPPDLDAALVLGMASTALPFAPSAKAEAERWLRILRLHGEAGATLQALGVSEAPLEGPPAREIGLAPDEAPDFAPHPDLAREDPVTAVSERAARLASGRGAQTVGSADVLVAVMHVYGGDFDRVLHVHGTDRHEVLQRLGARTAV